MNTRPPTLPACLPAICTGNGFDVHAFEAGDHVTLCGVRIAHEMALAGHSDADVALHALVDALLGCIAAGDIGSHFPPTDGRWRDAPSRVFVEHALGLITEQGGVLSHCDITIICEAPKLRPHIDAMRTNLADILGIDVKRVSVKATTTERLGFIGRGEGIAALATATVLMGR